MILSYETLLEVYSVEKESKIKDFLWFFYFVQ